MYVLNENEMIEGVDYSCTNEWNNYNILVDYENQMSVLPQISKIDFE